MGYFISITASTVVDKLTPQTVVVDSPLRDSWPFKTLPFYSVTMFTKLYSDKCRFDVGSLITCWLKTGLKLRLQ